MSSRSDLEDTTSVDTSQLSQSQPDPPERPGVFRRLWQALTSGFHGRDQREPFDFRRFDFPRLDIDRAAEELRLVELAEANARHEIPRTEDEVFDAPQERVVQFVRGEVAHVSATYQTSLVGLNTRISEIDVPGHLRALTDIPKDLEHKLEAMEHRLGASYSKAREVFETARSEYEAFRAKNGLEREPRYPESKFNSIALLVFVAVLEGLLNAYFFASGSEFGYVGGASYAFLLAAVDIFVVFSLGRLIAWVVARDWAHRSAAIGAAGFFAIWAIGFNLLVGHIREALQAAPDQAMAVAQKAFQASPIGLSQADSWFLVAFGLVLSVLAMVDGLRWDDPFPGYGAAHRKLIEALEEVEHWKQTWRESTIGLLDESLDRIGNAVRDLKRDVVALERTIETKELLLRNVRNFSSHYEESCNALIRLYRDANLQRRSTEPPAYFARAWRLRLPDRLSDSTEADQHRLSQAREAVAHADAEEAEARRNAREAYTRSVARLEAEVSS